MASKRVHLTFNKEHVREPILWQIGQKHNIVMNIRRADIQQDMGWVELEMSGESDSLEKGLKAFTDLGVRVDPIEVQTITG